MKAELIQKYGKEIEILNSLNRMTAYSPQSIGISEYALRTIYANGLVSGLYIEQCNSNIYSITIYNI